jgi:hypothetical protein
MRNYTEAVMILLAPEAARALCERARQEGMKRAVLARRYVMRGLQADGIVAARPPDEQLDATAAHKSGGTHDKAVDPAPPPA